MVDIVSAVASIVLLPVLIFLVKKPGGLLSNAVSVLAGGRTWIGYDTPAPSNLPKIKPGILPPYNLIPSFDPGTDLKAQLNVTYAQQYKPMTDVGLILKNYKYLGGF
jgi:hypothetical protein